jgi:hypothetical protein
MKNPYMYFGSPHPVEEALHRVENTSLYDETDSFKSHRGAVLEYLELQYIKTETAYDELRCLLTTEIQANCFFDLNTIYDRFSYVKRKPPRKHSS